MVDYSRAAASKAAKDNFDSTAASLIRDIESLKEEFEKEWGVVEELRKGRAAIVESVIPILKEHDVKLDKPLSRCNQEELIEELTQSAEILPFTAREEIEVAKVRIAGRYAELQKQAEKLEELNIKLSNYHLPEKDHDKEIVVSFEEMKKARETKNEQPAPSEVAPTRESRVREDANDPDLEEVASVTPASEEILSSFDELVEEEKAKLAKNVATPKILEESDIVTIGNYPEENYSEEETVEIDFNNAFDNLFGDEDDNYANDEDVMSEFLENVDEEMAEEAVEEEVDYQTYELKGNQTLAETVEYVYEGKLSWYDIYRYGHNQGMIDRKCAEMRIDPEDAAYTPGVLSGINIEYPKNYVTYESYKNSEGKGIAKAA